MHLIVALVFVRQGDKILLVRQNYAKPLWALPGGVVEAGESLEEAAVREVREETGLFVRLTRLVGVYSKRSEDAVAVTFEGEVVGGSLTPDGDEVIECAFFSRDQLPEPTRLHLVQRIEDYWAGKPEAFFRCQD